MPSYQALAESEESGVAVRSEFGVTEVVRQAEVMQAALMAQQKALIEARFIVAYRQRRRWDEVRIAVNRMCQDPEFAAEALYVKPISRTPEGWNTLSKRDQLRSAPDNWPQGFSVRFIEAALFECGNFDCPAVVVWEDDEKRITQVSVIDLERNSAYHRTVVTPKTIERRNLKKGEEALSERINSFGETIFILPATPDQVASSEASGVSKALRTLGERLLRPDYKREWRARCEAAIMDAAAKDPEGEKKRILDGFSEKGVMPSAVEAYMEKSLIGLTPAEILQLRKIYTAIANGECSWKDVMEAKFGAGGDDGPLSPAAQKLKDKLAKMESDPVPKASAGMDAKPTPDATAKPSVSTATGDPEPKGNPAEKAAAVEIKRYGPKNGFAVYSALPAMNTVPHGQRVYVRGEDGTDRFYKFDAEIKREDGGEGEWLPEDEPQPPTSGPQRVSDPPAGPRPLRGTR